MTTTATHDAYQNPRGSVSPSPEDEPARSFDRDHTTWHAYDYALVRVVPRVHTGAFADVGVVLHARTASFLGLRLLHDPDHLAACCRGILPLDTLRRHLDAYERVCHGDGDDALCALPPSERFHWLTAPRSTVLQTSELHPGRTRDPEACLAHLFRTLVAT